MIEDNADFKKTTKVYADQTAEERRSILMRKERMCLFVSFVKLRGVYKQKPGFALSSCLFKILSHLNYQHQNGYENSIWSSLSYGRYYSVKKHPHRANVHEIFVRRASPGEDDKN